MTFFLMIFYTWFKFNDQKYKVEDIEYSIIFSFQKIKKLKFKITFQKSKFTTIIYKKSKFLSLSFFLEII